MNPDKLFDYLEGKLPDWERAQLEEKIAEDPQLQKEFAAARRIHSNMRGERREVMIPQEGGSNARGRKMALRIGTAFIILIAVNVGAGLYFIARHEAANPNHKLLEAQMRDQITKSLRLATQSALTPPPLELGELTISANPGQLQAVAEKIVTLARGLGGSATVELPDGPRLGVLVDVPANRETEFRTAMATLSGKDAGTIPPNDTSSTGADKRSFVVHIVEHQSH